MSSRVLSGPGGALARGMAWRTVGPGGSLAPLGPEGAGGLSAAALAELEARLSEMQQQARQREQEAYQNGLRQGRAQGAEEATTRLEPVIERMRQAVEEILAQRRRFRREAEEDVVRLAVAIGRRILRRELSLDPEALLGVVKAAMQKLEGREVHRLRLHPAEADVVRKYFAQSGCGERIEIQPDATLERGAALFDTVHGSLDASVETQLEEIQRGLTDLVQGGR